MSNLSEALRQVRLPDERNQELLVAAADALDRAEAACARNHQSTLQMIQSIGDIFREENAAWQVERARHGKALDEVVRERDEYHGMADRLATAIADHLLVPIGENSNCNCPWMRALEAIENVAPQASDAARQQRTEDSLPSYLLSAERVGMQADYTSLLGWACHALKRGETAPAAAEMLRQLYIHLTELGRRWYSGDSAAVDELLQLYRIESDTRAALVAPPDSPIKENRVGANYGHGHVWDRPDGLVTKCRGPGLCIICSDDKAQWQRRNREPRI